MQRVVKSSSHPLLFSLAYVGVGAYALLTVSIGWDFLGFARSCDGANCDTLVHDLLIIVLLLLLFGPFTVWYIRHEFVVAVTKDRRRQNAARGVGRIRDIEHELLSGDHPDLVLPITLILRMNWRSRTTWLIFGIAFGIGQFAFACAMLSIHNNPTFTLVGALLSEGVLLLILGFVLFVFWLASRQSIRVSVEGIRVRSLGRTRSVRWSDIRLFGLVDPRTYELSSARVIVRFWRPAEVDTSISTIPFPEYQRQMVALLLLIGARTGLPLYDLVSTTQ